MARNARITCPAGVWTRLTAADAAADISIMLANWVPVSLQATADATTPTDARGPLELMGKGDGWSEATIVEKFPGVAAAVNIWAKPIEADIGLGAVDAVIGISHA